MVVDISEFQRRNWLSKVPNPDTDDLQSSEDCFLEISSLEILYCNPAMLKTQARFLIKSH